MKKRKKTSMRTLISVLLGCIVSIGITLPAIASDNINIGRQRTPVYEVNSRGQTYGSLVDSISPETEPDLILVQTDDGTFGYVRAEDLAEEMPNSPEEAVAMMQERERRMSRYSNGLRKINVYDSEGNLLKDKYFEVEH